MFALSPPPLWVGFAMGDKVFEVPPARSPRGEGRNEGLVCLGGGSFSVCPRHSPQDEGKQAKCAVLLSFLTSSSSSSSSVYIFPPSSQAASQSLWLSRSRGGQTKKNTDTALCIVDS